MLPLNPSKWMTPLSGVCMYVCKLLTAIRTPLVGDFKITGNRGNSTPQTPSYQYFQPLPVEKQTGNRKNENRCNAVTATVSAVTRK